MDRRNFVIGIGGIATSAGLIAGSGAFSQIEADRNMSVTVADDSTAYLSLAEGSGDAAYTGVDADNNIELTFGTVNEADGANDNAVSWFDALVEVGNNGDNQVTLGYSLSDSGGADVTEGLSLYTGNASGTTDDLDGQTLAAYSDTDGKDTLEFGVEMDTSVIDGDTYTVTISATQT